MLYFFSSAHACAWLFYVGMRRGVVIYMVFATFGCKVTVLSSDMQESEPSVLPADCTLPAHRSRRARLPRFLSRDGIGLVPVEDVYPAVADDLCRLDGRFAAGCSRGRLRDSGLLEGEAVEVHWILGIHHAVNTISSHSEG